MILSVTRGGVCKILKLNFFGWTRNKINPT
jgi:hypothetical protein